MGGYYFKNSQCSIVESLQKILWYFRLGYTFELWQDLKFFKKQNTVLRFFCFVLFLAVYWICHVPSTVVNDLQ